MSPHAKRQIITVSFADPQPLYRESGVKVSLTGAHDLAVLDMSLTRGGELGITEIATLGPQELYLGIDPTLSWDEIRPYVVPRIAESMGWTLGTYDVVDNTADGREA